MRRTTTLVVLVLAACSRSESTERSAPQAVTAVSPSTGKSLLDESVELAQGCGADAPKRTVGLLARASVKALDAKAAASFGLEWNAVGHALIRCAPHGEALMRSWLDGPLGPRTAAARALASRARSGHRLDDTTVVKLLQQARELESPGWLALGALPSVNRSLANRILEAVSRLATDPARINPNAVALLAKVGPTSVPLLSTIVAGDEFSDRTRQAAVTALAQLGPGGQTRLTKLLVQPLGPRVLSEVVSVSPDAANTSRARLRELARTPLATNADRDRVLLRCHAASQLAPRWYRDLAQCDPSGRLQGRLAEIRVLRRTPVLQPDGRKRWRALLASDDPRVRQAALLRLEAHPDDPDFQQVMRVALGDSNPGTVAVAARILRDLANDAKAPPLDSELRKMLEEQLAKPTRNDAAATTIALLQAGAALGHLSLKPFLARHCDSPFPAVTQAAQVALETLLADAKCEGSRHDDARKTLPEGVPTTGQVTLEFEFETLAAKLTLERAWAPRAVAQITRLAKSGFYSGQHLLGPAPSVLQFGDPDGDGFANGDHTVLPSELTAHPFKPLSVGLAQTGPGTGSTQVFVVLDDRPDLDLSYPILGKADSAWQNLGADDEIVRVRVLSP
jgi:cyclophilin family peptidyl-prolyl cis-trans isomerase